MLRVLLASVMPLAVTQAAAIATSVPMHRGLAPRTLRVQRPWMGV